MGKKKVTKEAPEVAVLTNRKFAEKDEQFKAACGEVIIKSKTSEEFLKPTGRQASKFRMKKGLAYKVGLPSLKEKK